jgi:hypothetical protein
MKERKTNGRHFMLPPEELQLYNVLPFLYSLLLYGFYFISLGSHLICFSHFKLSSALVLGKPSLDSKPYGSFFQCGALSPSW